MLVIFRSDPTGLPALAALTTGGFAFLAALLIARGRRQAEPEVVGAERIRASGVGVVVQGLGIGIGAFGPQRVALDPQSAAALGQAAIVAILMAGAVALFVWASRTMGRNWSIRARMRTDHQLVTDGPFALIRHPIYTAMGLFAVALAIAFGHPRQLILGLPVFAVGTWIRVRNEEALLCAMFGDAYVAWSRRVKRFVPGLF